MGTREEVVTFIRSCVISTKEKLSLRQLNKDYKLLMGEWIPFQRLGFKSLEDLIQSSSDLMLSRMGGDVYVRAKTSEKSVHMTELVSNQKTAKRKPQRVRFSRHPSPPRMHQTSRWRPKSKFQSNRYTSSKRPEAVSHSQFVNKSPVAAKAPPVSSKIVIPEHSSYSSKHSQPVAPTPTVRRAELNQRLTSNRVQENMKALQNSSAQNGFDYTANHNGTSLPSDPIANDLNTNKIKSFLLDLNDNSTDPLMSTRKRLNKKISELSLDRDSGNSSPTNDVSPPSPSKTPEFVRTQDPLADLKNFAQIHKLGEVTVSITQVNPKRQKFYSCKIKVGQKHTYTSYPEEFRNPLEAQTFCCEQAFTDLVPKCKRKSLMISSERDILARIPPMLEKHNHGIWAWQLKLDYADKYNELLSDDWLKIIDSSPCVHIEKMSEDYILYHCQPGDVLQKGQHRGAGSVVPLTNVSVPANTVQFGDDGRLVGLVTSVISANEIWCEQVGTEESNRFAEMFERMQIYYQEHEGQLVPETIFPAGYYVAKCEGVYYRVRAVKISNEEVDCFFIDCGDEMAVPKTDMFVLKRVYATSQAQAFVCRLFGLEDLYDFSANSQSLASLFDKSVILELATDLTNHDNSMVLPVIMYDVDTGCSINEQLISALTMELATPHLQPEGITEVYVSHMESNGDVYVQVRTQGYDNLQLLRSQIEELVTTKPPKEIVYKVSKSNSREKLYFMKHTKNDIWYRIKLIDWSPEGEFAQVYFVDEGFTDVIRVAAETLYPLEMLNDVFNNYPYQATRVRMALDLIPPNFVDLASKSMPEESPVLLKIVGATEDNIPLVKMFKRNSDGGLFCINESVALHTEINSKKEDSVKTKLKFSQFGGLDNVPSTGTLKCPPLPQAGDDVFLKVHIPVAVNPYNFFVQPFDSRSELDAMMERLQERYKDVNYSNLKVEDVLPGSIYASKHDDGFWYRTSVIKVIHSGASVSVFYCDFGYYQTLSVKQLIPLDNEFMELPYQALKAKLGDIKPKQNKWTMEDCEQFKELVEGKLLFARLVNTEKDILYESDLVLKLLLIDTSSDDDIIISHELVRRGIAVAAE